MKGQTHKEFIQQLRLKEELKQEVYLVNSHSVKFKLQALKKEWIKFHLN
jgi:hypothetical protein